jgi:predicted negative regulator of RcsB-dependent stress response
MGSFLPNVLEEEREPAMLKPKKRLTRRQIKEDKLVTYYFKVNDWVNRHAVQVVAGVVLVILVLLASSLWSQKQRRAEGEASVELAKARIAYDQGNYQAAIEVLEGLVNRYGSTRSGVTGLYYLANAYFNTGDYDAAQRYFKAYERKGKDPMLKAAAKAGVAACLEQQGQYLEAARIYEETAQKYSDHFAAPQYLMDAGRNYTLAGSLEDARRVYQMVTERYPKSILVTEAEIRLAELQAN